MRTTSAGLKAALYPATLLDLARKQDFLDGVMPSPIVSLPRALLVAGIFTVGLLLVAAFLAGRFYPHPRQPVQLAAADPQAGERILLVAVGDYLERSQMVLIELANARSPGSLDISAEQERAVDLVSENRLYRQTAGHTGDAAVASVLDELERVLLDITHAPSRLSPGELEKLRQRLEAEGILFKIRVLGSNVRNQEEKGSEAAPRAAGQKS